MKVYHCYFKMGVACIIFVFQFFMAEAAQHFDVAVFLREYDSSSFDAIHTSFFYAVAQHVPIVVNTPFFKSFLTLQANGRIPYFELNITILKAGIDKYHEIRDKLRLSIKTEPSDNKYQLERLESSHDEVNKLINKNEEKIKQYADAIKVHTEIWQRLVDEIKNPKIWKIYTNVEKDFVVLLPLDYPHLTLPTGLISIEPQFINPNFGVENIELSVSHLLEFLNILAPSGHIRMFLHGHGNRGVVAHLNSEQYNELLTGLEKHICDFLYVSSCFAGGWNQVLMHQKNLEKDFKKYQISFPIVVASVADFTSSVLKEEIGDKQTIEHSYYNNLKLKSFFTKINDFYRHQERTSITHWVKEPFKSICMELYPKIPLENWPLIRLPGCDSYFRALEIDRQVMVLTYPWLIAYELQAFKPSETKEIVVGEEVVGEEELSIVEERIKPSQGKRRKEMRLLGKEAVLLYPSILRLPISIPTKIPKIISMIPGNARHYLQSINAENFSLEQVLDGMFLFAKSHNLIGEKLFFIKELQCTNYNGSGLLHSENPEDDNPSQKLKLNNVIITIRGYEGMQRKMEFYYTISFQLNGVVFSSNDWDREQDKKNNRAWRWSLSNRSMNDLIENALQFKPHQAALWEATGGIETDQQFEDLVRGRTWGQKIKEHKKKLEEKRKRERS